MNGIFQSSPKAFQKGQQKKRQGREKHSLKKSQFQRNEGQARQKQKQTNEGAAKTRTQKGKNNTTR
jgi:hypothetical protein